MKRTIYISLILIIVGVLGATIGFFAGVNEGIKQFFMIESSVKASLLTHELRSLRDNDLETSITSKEIELDGEVVKFTKFQREGRPWVFLFLGGVERDHEKYMRNVASYRKEYPAVLPTIEYSNDNSMKEEMEQYKKKVVEATESVVNEFGE
jgi:hypothetical protein